MLVLNVTYVLNNLINFRVRILEKNVWSQKWNKSKQSMEAVCYEPNENLCQSKRTI